jgi:hypothetical protein
MISVNEEDHLGNEEGLETLFVHSNSSGQISSAGADFNGPEMDVSSAQISLPMQFSLFPRL